MAGVAGTKISRRFSYNPPEEVKSKLPPPVEGSEEEIKKMLAEDLEKFRVLQEKLDAEHEEGKAEREAAGTL